jgi:hypothetical protein
MFCTLPRRSCRLFSCSLLRLKPLTLSFDRKCLLFGDGLEMCDILGRDGSSISQGEMQESLSSHTHVTHPMPLLVQHQPLGVLCLT